MIPKLLAALLRFSVISLVAGDFVQESEQTPLSLEQTLHDNQIVQKSDSFKAHGPVSIIACTLHSKELMLSCTN